MADVFQFFPALRQRLEFGFFGKAEILVHGISPH
jgi:hypothetical protein